MNASERKYVRLAGEIQQQLQKLKDHRIGEVQSTIPELLDSTERMKAARRKLIVCAKHGWKAAETKVLRDLESALHEFPYYVQRIDRAIRPCKVQAPSLREIYQDLIQGKDEFGEVRYDRDDGFLAITTEPIRLEGVYLGEFEIRLYINEIGGLDVADSYTVVALDPNPAAGNDSVTHPHVNNDRLCAGDGAAAITSSLSTGRICDFFTLVQSILKTYNPSSPHIPLKEWDGRSCAECGYSVYQDEVYFCQTCESDVCGECAHLCRVCEETVCPTCLLCCPVCDNPVCPCCMVECGDCATTLCSTCLDNNQCKCEEIEEEELDNENEQEETGVKGIQEATEERSSSQESGETGHEGLHGCPAEVGAA